MDFAYKQSDLLVCGDMKTEACTTSDGGTSSPEEFVLPVDLQTPVKKEEPEDEGYLGADASSAEIRVITVGQQSEGLQRIAIKEEEPEDDEFLYCDDCQSYFTNKCEVHGPALFVSDTPVPMGVPNRAMQTLPPSLEVRKSEIPDAGLGVFNKGETIPPGAHFGPFEGDLVDKEAAMNSGYSWVITRNMQCEKYIDGQREVHSNWMRYVNCARNEEEQNLVAFQYRGGVLYRCRQPIETGQELLMWYKDDYGKHLGLEFDYLWKKKCSSNEMTDAPLPPFPCSRCELAYASKTYLNTHIRRSHSDADESPNPCSGAPETGTNRTPGRSRKSRVRSGVGLTERPRFLCSQCGKSFNYQSHLQQHRHIHTGEKPYRCPECGKSFNNQSNYKQHRRIHTGEKLHRCSECGKSFNNRSNYRQHQRIHTGEKPCRCVQCGKGFAYQSQLQQHQQIHTGEKPHRCAECGTGFNKKSTLERHRLTHGGEKPHRCSRCGKGFLSPSNLKDHERIHTGEKPHRCSHCEKSFISAGNLKDHQHVHTGEKLYPCTQCGKSFSKQGHLRNHQRIHTGEKPFQCSQCGKSFNQKSNLQKHHSVHA